MAPCTHPDMKRLFCLKAKNGLVMKRLFFPKRKKNIGHSARSALLISSREVNEARRPLACSRPRVLEIKETKKERNPTTFKTHHEIHSNPAAATTSRRRATKHILRVSPYLHASIDPGSVEMGLGQLSKSVKTTWPIDTCTTLLACQLAAGRKMRDATPF